MGFFGACVSWFEIQFNKWNLVFKGHFNQAHQRKNYHQNNLILLPSTEVLILFIKQKLFEPLSFKS